MTAMLAPIERSIAGDNADGRSGFSVLFDRADFVFANHGLDPCGVLWRKLALFRSEDGCRVRSSAGRMTRDPRSIRSKDFW